MDLLHARLPDVAAPLGGRSDASLLPPGASRGVSLALSAIVLLWGARATPTLARPRAAVAPPRPPGGTALVLTIVAIIQASRVAAPLGPGLALASGLGYEAAIVTTAHP